jgi:hypothetical protein
MITSFAAKLEISAEFERQAHANDREVWDWIFNIRLPIVTSRTPTLEELSPIGRSSGPGTDRPPDQTLAYKKPGTGPG